MNQLSATLEQVPAKMRGLKIDPATLAAAKRMTEELFKSPVGIRSVEDPGESPYSTLVVKAGPDADPDEMIKLHSIWHDKILELAPTAAANLCLNVAYE